MKNKGGELEAGFGQNSPWIGFRDQFRDDVLRPGVTEQNT